MRELDFTENVSLVRGTHDLLTRQHGLSVSGWGDTDHTWRSRQTVHLALGRQPRAVLGEQIGLFMRNIVTDLGFAPGLALEVSPKRILLG